MAEGYLLLTLHITLTISLAPEEGLYGFWAEKRYKTSFNLVVRLHEQIPPIFFRELGIPAAIVFFNTLFAVSYPARRPRASPNSLCAVHLEKEPFCNVFCPKRLPFQTHIALRVRIRSNPKVFGFRAESPKQKYAVSEIFQFYEFPVVARDVCTLPNRSDRIR